MSHISFAHPLVKFSLRSAGWFLVGLTLTVVVADAVAAPGDLDPTFGNGGQVSSTNFSGYALAIQPDGKIVAVGTSGNFPYGAFTLERYNTDGSLDASFGSGGRVVTPLSDGMATSVAMAVVIQPDGKILTAGDGFFYIYEKGQISIYDGGYALARYNTDGSPDTSFGAGGRVVTQTVYGIVEPSSVALQSDGKIAVAGYKRGTLIGGEAGWDFLVARYKKDGTIDTSFGSGGTVTTSFSDGEFGLDEATDLAIQSDGKIVAAGHSRVNGTVHEFRFVFARYTTDGSLDSTFGSGGKVVTPFGDDSDGARQIVIQPDGKIVAVGSGGDYPNTGFALARYNIDGALDTSFGTSGKVLTLFLPGFGGAGTVAIQSDGRIVATGYGYQGANSNITLAKYNTDGSLDVAFGSNGKVFTPFGDISIGNDAAIQADGKIVVLAEARYPAPAFALFRYLNNSHLNLYDFDGDHKADLSIFRPSVGEWYFQRSTTGVTNGFGFGTSTDKPVPADFTGDGKADIAFWRASNGNWFVLRSEDSTFFAFPFGASGDIPAPADYDGDGKSDAAVFRPSIATWFILKSTGGVSSIQFGLSTDVPEPADYDGDGKADVGIYRPGPGQWWNLRSSNGSVFAATFGSSTDKPVPGDYTGDGKADVAFYRPSEGSWYVLRSEDFSFFAFPFGNSTDKPAPADFDGDGKFDAAVFRPSDTNWYILKSTGGVQIQHFGAANDIPLPGSFVP